MDELKKTKELVEKYLKKKYPDKKFSEPDLEFLARYSVKKEGCESEILKDLGLICGKDTVQIYYDAHETVKEANVFKISISALTPKEIAKRKRKTL